MGVKLKKNGGSVSWKKYYQNKAPNYFNNNNKEIKRLQEENEKLKEQLDMLVKDDEKQQKIIIELQQRIDKEIEYIENDVEVYYVFDTRLQKTFDKTKKVKKDLLDILRGEDNV